MTQIELDAFRIVCHNLPKIADSLKRIADALEKNGADAEEN